MSNDIPRIPEKLAGLHVERPDHGDMMAPQPMKKDIDLSEYRGPKTLVVGCGGCGINIARLIAKSSQSDMLFIDTGRANVFPDENLFVIGKGEGSGGVAHKNAEAAVKQIPTITLDPEQTPDIAIVCFSMSGGSGMFVGPYVIKTFLERGIQCVAIGIMDACSVLQADNTIQCLGNLTSLSEKANVTLPMMVFDNRKTPRDVLNPIVASKGRVLVRMLVANTMEVDRNDRRHFLDGTATHDAAPGLRLLNVFEGDTSDEQGQPLFPEIHSDVVESVLVIRGNDQGKLVDMPGVPELTQFRKDGYFLEGAKPVMGVITADLSPVNDPIKKITAMTDRVTTHSQLGGNTKINLPTTTKKGKTANFF